VRKDLREEAPFLQYPCGVWGELNASSYLPDFSKGCVLKHRGDLRSTWVIFDVRSKIITLWPTFAMPIAAERPPMPQPTIAMLRGSTPIAKSLDWKPNYNATIGGAEHLQDSGFRNTEGVISTSGCCLKQIWISLYQEETCRGRQTRPERLGEETFLD